MMAKDDSEVVVECRIVRKQERKDLRTVSLDVKEQNHCLSRLRLQDNGNRVLLVVSDS